MPIFLPYNFDLSSTISPRDLMMASVEYHDSWLFFLADLIFPFVALAYGIWA